MKLFTPSTKEEWLAIRKGYISSTESAALFGMSPYSTAFEVAVGKRDDLDLFQETDRTQWGVRLQDAIAQGVADDYGIVVEGMGMTYAAKEDVRMGSSFDYKIVDSVSTGKADCRLRDHFYRLGPGLLEVKNVDALAFKNKWNDGGEEAPEHIEIQLQHQLEVIGHSWGCIAALVGGNRVHLIVRERDLGVGAKIRGAINAFWRNFDRGILPPPIMPQDAEIVIAMNQYAEPSKLVDKQDDETARLLVSEYHRLGLEIKSLSEAREVAKAHILLSIGDAEKALVDGFRVSATMRPPVEVAAYTRKGFRDFRVTVQKEKKSG